MFPNITLWTDIEGECYNFYFMGEEGMRIPGLSPKGTDG
jgi:hypothetical protein